MHLTADAQAMVLLCSHLGLSNRPELKPLTLSEWNPIAQRLQESPLKRPGALLGISSQELQQALSVSVEGAERLSRLLDRGGALAIELERLTSLGLWVVTRADSDYPQRWRERLRAAAPAVIFGAGERVLLGQPGVAVVGSRSVDAEGESCAEFIGSACAKAGFVLYSGGARGVDSLSTQASLNARGTAVGILANSLEQAVRPPEIRAALARGDLALVTPYGPDAGFSVGAAMGRNRLIYTLADYAIVVASDTEKGGTWAGATEALKAKWVPVFVLTGPTVPEGNRHLLEKGGIAFSVSSLTASLSLRDWLSEHVVDSEPPLVQAKLF